MANTVGLALPLAAHVVCGGLVVVVGLLVICIVVASIFFVCFVGFLVFVGVWWMPWCLELMKDVVACDIPWGVGERALIRGFPNGVT